MGGLVAVASADAPPENIHALVAAARCAGAWLTPNFI